MRALIRLFCAVLHATCWVARSGATYLQQAAGGHFGNAKCPCIGLEMSGEVLVNVSQRNINYPASVGSRCKAWDHGLHPDCKKENSPAWCKSKWCYVDPCNCKIPLPPRKTLTSSKVRNKSLFWSYDTCGDTNTFFFSAASGQACAKQTTFNACVGVDDCLWDGEQCYSWERREIMKTCKQQDSPEDMYGKSTCKCIGPALRVGYVNLTLDSKGFFPYPASVGGECKAWDDGFHPDCRKRNSPDWCKSRWCYVDPCSCVLPDSLPKLSRSGAKFQGRPIYSSYSTCGGKDTFDKGHESLKFPPSFCAAEQLVVLKPGPAPAPVPAAVAAAAVATGAGVGSQTPSPDPDAAAAASAAAAAAALAPSSPSAANAAANAGGNNNGNSNSLAVASAGSTPMSPNTDAANLLQGIDEVPPNFTTVMFRNIPNKYTRDMLVRQLEEDMRGLFDFVYLPIDFKNKCNVGYAFINFRSVEACMSFVNRFNGVEVRKCLPGLNSRKVTEVTPARVQGFDENVQRLRNSPVMRELASKPEWMPLIFDSDGVQLPFPMPERPLDPIKPRRRARDQEEAWSQPMA
mmetsp:Transcript_104876/g.191520  ORF Transcript_104876/g.191520 Transcript_104876/m.191520 type:complete len:573 (-) Transcript_104876:132-1850(-)